MAQHEVPEYSESLTAVYVSGGGMVGIELDDGDQLYLFNPRFDGLEEVSALEGDWRRVWP